MAVILFTALQACTVNVSFPDDVNGDYTQIFLPSARMALLSKAGLERAEMA
jgi:hypothetical protein